MFSVEKVKYVGGYKIWCQFSNSKEGIVDLKDNLWGPIFEPLNDKEKFKKFKISDVFHTIVWENGADIAPEYLYDHIHRKYPCSWCGADTGCPNILTCDKCKAKNRKEKKELSVEEISKKCGLKLKTLQPLHK